MALEQGQSNTMNMIRVKDPDMYDVAMLNDDFTTMEFVVIVLRQVFYHTEAEAERLMLDIHHKGQCIVGTYTLDIAQSKVSKATQMARGAGFPLRLKLMQHK